MLPKAENQYIEFKREETTAQTLAEEVVAFANGEGGEIWLGLDDQGTPLGLSRNYEEDVMNICRTAVIPPITPSYEALQVNNAAGHLVNIARIGIPKGSDRPYYTSKNRYFIRVGSTKRTASREELTRLFQAAGLFHYDIVEVGGAQLKHLNLNAIADYFNRYHIDFLQENEEERLRLISASDIASENLVPTVGGLLVFGISPERLLSQSGISFAAFDGAEITSALRDKKNLLGALPMQIDNTLAAIKANIPTPSEIVGTRRIDQPHYPDKVFRELLVNACVHRNYSITGSQIRVFLFTDRIEFIRPRTAPEYCQNQQTHDGNQFLTQSVTGAPIGESGLHGQTGTRFADGLSGGTKTGQNAGV